MPLKNKHTGVLLIVVTSFRKGFVSSSQSGRSWDHQNKRVDTFSNVYRHRKYIQIPSKALYFNSDEILAIANIYWQMGDILGFSRCAVLF